jgi:iron(III) transport system ATP-binding protein
MSDQDRRHPLVVEQLRKTFADRTARVTAIDGVSFEIRDGELYTLLGPSGCGKTSTLRAVAGLENPDEGRITIAGEVVSDGDQRRFVPPNKRDTGMVFQSYGIWPHMTVFENAAFPLRVAKAKVSKAQLRERVERALGIVRLSGYEGRMATQLSGGQQQRLALARALIRQPKLLLLDEPLSNLDAKLREAMRAEVATLQQELGVTTLYVTHDQDEALSMSSRIAVMSEGQIVQEGTPRQIYEQPATRFVADFVGTTNFLDASIVAGGSDHVTLDTEVGELTAAASGAGWKVGDAVVAAVRPESLRVHLAEAPTADNVLHAEVDRVMFVGDSLDCHLRVGSSSWITRQDARLRVEHGQRVWVEVPSDGLSLIRAEAA